jgi:hypothetical protein
MYYCCILGELLKNYFHEQDERGHSKIFRICEGIFASVLGGKSTAWYSARRAVTQGVVAMKERDAPKGRQAAAFIARFLQGCDIPPTKYQEG